MHEDKKQNEPSVSPKRSAAGDADDTVPAKRPRAQEEISSEQVILDPPPPCIRPKKALCALYYRSVFHAIESNIWFFF